MTGIRNDVIVRCFTQCPSHGLCISWVRHEDIVSARQSCTGPLTFFQTECRHDSAAGRALRDEAPIRTAKLTDCGGEMRLDAPAEAAGSLE